MRTWILLAIAMLAFTACSQAANAPNEPEKEDVEKGTQETLPETTLRADAPPVLISCSDFLDSQGAEEFYANVAIKAEKEVLDADGDGVPCNEPGVVFAQAPEEPTFVPEPTVIPKTPEFNEWNCRGDAYMAEQGMDAAEQEAFANELADRLIEDIEAGGDKKMGDIMDEMGVPAYEECG